MICIMVGKMPTYDHSPATMRLYLKYELNKVKMWLKHQIHQIQTDFEMLLADLGLHSLCKDWLPPGVPRLSFASSAPPNFCEHFTCFALLSIPQSPVQSCHSIPMDELELLAHAGTACQWACMWFKRNHISHCISSVDIFVLIHFLHWQDPFLWSRLRRRRLPMFTSLYVNICQRFQFVFHCVLSQHQSGELLLFLWCISLQNKLRQSDLCL